MQIDCRFWTPGWALPNPAFAGGQPRSTITFDGFGRAIVWITRHIRRSILTGPASWATSWGRSMERFRDLLLNVWREACRHIEIHESTETIARMLHRHMPVAEVIVREIDVERSRLETV